MRIEALLLQLARAFDPEHLDATCEALAAAQAPSPAEEARVAAAQRTLAEAEARLQRYRGALDAGAEPSVMAAWIREAAELKQRAERELGAAEPAPAPTPEEIRRLLEDLGDAVSLLQEADPAKKADLYASLGLSLVYQPRERRVLVEADLAVCHDLAVCQDRVGGGT